MSWFGRSEQRAFRAGAVVAADVDDQCVVELAHVLDRLDDAADLVVGVGRITCEDLRLTRKELLFVSRQRFPFRQLIRPRGQLGIRGITPSRFWLAKICSRMPFQPMSNLPLNFSIHSCFGWCGEWVPPGT